MCLKVANLLRKGAKQAGIPALSIRAVELSTITTGTSEAPDIIAYRQGIGDSVCMVFEIKLSRSDFKADAKKKCRAEKSMGVQRYFVVPDGLVTPEEIPNGWGLLYLRGRSLVSKKKSKLFTEEDRNIYGEINTLLNLMRRGAIWGETFDNDDYHNKRRQS